MVKQSKRFQLWLEPEVHKTRETLPGHVRQQIKLALENLAQQPRPPRSRKLVINDMDLPAEVEVRRLRLGKWRILYAVNDTEGWVWVLAIRQRPPYQYEDLLDVIEKLV